MASYEELASIYDYIMSDVDYNTWYGHYHSLLSLSHSMTRIMEIGCGTGNFTALLSNDYTVHAVEPSEKMLHEAQKKLSGRNVTFEQAGMTDYTLPETPFDAVVSTFDVMNYACSVSMLREAFGRIAHSLRREGRFIFDVNTDVAFKLHLFDEDVEHPETGYSHVWRGVYDPSTRLEHVEMKYYRDGELCFCENHIQRAHSREEIWEALKDSGFERIIFLDAVTMAQANEKTDRWLIAATKR